MGGAIGMALGAFWPLILWTLLKFVGYAVIGITNGHGRQFVNSTFFRCADRMGVDLHQLLNFAHPSVCILIGNVCKIIDPPITLGYHFADQLRNLMF